MPVTTHSIYYNDARYMQTIPSESIDLIVTSPPYPMIEMWDEVFSSLSDDIRNAMEKKDGDTAFEAMHLELDKAWEEAFRVMKSGGFACINIGDATRSIGGKFRLYSNHARIIEACRKTGFETLPLILWRKQTNAPNKFMGSGMLPAGAYITLEHEYIIILRKNGRREFDSNAEKSKRIQSSYFWEERNTWFSDIWDFKGIRQDMVSKENNDIRKRSAAFPFELPYRLINMYSLKGDTILDPFMGTGTTLMASIASCRSSIGIEIDRNFSTFVSDNVKETKQILNDYITDRLTKHKEFVEEYEKNKGRMKHENNNYKFPVMTKQETDIILNYIREIKGIDDSAWKVSYDENAHIDEKEINLKFDFD